MRRVEVVVLLLLAFPSCGGEGAIGSRACEDVFADGRPTDEISDFESTCVDAAGGSSYVVSIVYDCDDGRQLTFNDYGWGYSGEAWHSPYDEKIFASQLYEWCNT
jgi:hypothetical protein